MEPGDPTATVTETPSVGANAPETSAGRGAMPIVTLLFFDRHPAVLHVGFSNQLERHPRAASQGDLRPEVYGSHADPVSFFSAYFVFAPPSAKLIEGVGYKRAMVLGLLTMSAGALLFTLE